MRHMTQKMPNARFLTAGDVARVLGVTPATVRLMHRTGRLTAAEETAGGIRLFHRADVEAFARNRPARRDA